MDSLFTATIVASVSAFAIPFIVALVAAPLTGGK